MTQKQEKNDFLQAIDAMGEASVLVIGDMMLDRYVYGEATRISPESPVPVLKIARENKMLGGAGNTLANLAGLGVQAEIAALIGEDIAAFEIERMLSLLGAQGNLLMRSAERPTAVKTRFLAGHQQLLRTDMEVSEAIPEALEKSFKKRVMDSMKANPPRAIILSDYGKGLLTDKLVKAMLKEAQSRDIPVLVDPKGLDYRKYRGASLVTPNKKELSEATGGMAVNSDEEVILAAFKLMQECGIEAVLATRGKDGMTLVMHGVEPVHIRGIDQDVFDVSGAGDAVISTMAAGMVSGLSMNKAAELANLAGSVVVSKVGTAPIRATELRTAVSKQVTRSAALESPADAVETVRRWRAKDLKVGFTNGCFDILHAGHVTYLQEARKACDRLVVGLNHDNSVKILKGPQRPVHNQENRAAVLTALSSVDMVVLFGAYNDGDDNTAKELIAMLQPDYYFKGGDYDISEIPEATTVMDHGGQVKVLSLVKGQSTSNSLKKLKS